MAESYRFPDTLRDLMAAALPEDTSLHGTMPELRNTYLPAAHVKALRPDSMLVVGIRGSGKSFWWAALQRKAHRAAIGSQIGIGDGTIISTGFGEKPSPDDYPGKDALASLVEAFSPRRIWQTVVLRHVGSDRLPRAFTALKNWPPRIKWVETHAEEVERCLFDADQDLERQNTYHLVLFDALDRTADDWKTMHALVRGLLQVLLDFRSYRRIRVKAFVRPDQIEDPEVTAFPDASKVLSEQTELNWRRADLYGLLWQYLANADPQGEVFRNGCMQLAAVRWESRSGIWSVPDALREDENTQRAVFHAIAGPWMGRDRRRGFPYSWLPSHLGDARRQVSPRSFLAALRHAAQDRPRAGQEYALHYESIKRGVQEASKIRVREMQEDYPWVESLMKPLAGISVPCPFEEIRRKWDENQVLARLQNSLDEAEIKLPPAHIGQGAEGVLEDLIGLGLVERISDGRVNLPDVYRVGFGMGRRGGVKPVVR
ncbi:MAG: hypothetical protein M1376_22415 [Planctomycetes bacterium]|nr:hypothetical protein [Planctomycetota bacterium]